MKFKIMYDLKTNISSAKKIISKTNYYVGLTKICPRCNKAIIGNSAISRKDNKTEICSNCGTLESLEQFIKFNKEKQKNGKEKNTKYNKRIK